MSMSASSSRRKRSAYAEDVNDTGSNQEKELHREERWLHFKPWVNPLTQPRSTPANDMFQPLLGRSRGLVARQSSSIFNVQQASPPNPAEMGYDSK